MSLGQTPPSLPLEGGTPTPVGSPPGGCACPSYHLTRHSVSLPGPHGQPTDAPQSSLESLAFGAATSSPPPGKGFSQSCHSTISLPPHRIREPDLASGFKMWNLESNLPKSPPPTAKPSAPPERRVRVASASRPCAQSPGHAPPTGPLLHLCCVFGFFLDAAFF